MKRTLTILFLIAFSSKILAQSYNNLVSDEQINQFMTELLNSKEQYKNAFNRTPKRIYFKPIHIGQANWSIFPKSYKNLDFDIRFKKLFERSDLNETDLSFMKEQYETIKETEWKFAHRRLKFRKKYRKNYFKYSIPIFNKNKSLAIMWRYKYCGSLCAYSELHIYELKKGKWIIKELIEGWMS